MPEIQLKNPLEWPAARPQTQRLMRQNHSTLAPDMQEQEAMAYLQDEINIMPQVSSAVLSADAVNLSSTLPTQHLSSNSGACLKLTIDAKQYYLACDKWLKMSHNIYVLHLALRHYRQLEEWGVGNMQSLWLSFSAPHAMASAATAGAETGAATAGATGAEEDWRLILGLGSSATLEDANAIYRQRAMKIGENDPEALLALNIAIQNARKVLPSSEG